MTSTAAFERQLAVLVSVPNFASFPRNPKFYVQPVADCILTVCGTVLNYILL